MGSYWRPARRRERQDRQGDTGSVVRTARSEDAQQARAGARVYSLLTDGSTVEIRAAGPEDAEAVQAMHLAMSPGNLYLRFFSMSLYSAGSEAARVCRAPGPDHAALLAWLGGRLVGVASYEPTGEPRIAEVTFAVADGMHGKGIATLLLEHLVSVARDCGVRAFTAQTLAENGTMLKVFAVAGLPVQRRLSADVVKLTIPLPTEADPGLDQYLDQVAARESRAGVASLQHVLWPASVAVVGASRRRGTVGREILHNIVTGGFSGQVYPVNPRALALDGLRCLASVDDLPQYVDMAVVAVPPAAVLEVAERCGQRGVRALVVITSVLGDQGVGLLTICRRYGMRLVGPNCFGVAVPFLGLDATFGAEHPAPGTAGVVVQSPGIGISLLRHLSELGIGVSSFASVGDKYDVSSNDLLAWWEHDVRTKLAVLSVESYGSPRKFARTARRVAQQMPVLTVIGGRSMAGQRAAASHTPAAATPLAAQEALFAQAGIVAVPGLGELVEAIALLASQPLPGDNRVAIVSNAGGAGALAVDACEDNGLRVAVLSEATQRRLGGLLPSGAAVAGPVDTTEVIAAAAFRSCLEEVAADDGVDALLVVTVPTAIAELTQAVATHRVGKPLAAAVLDQPQGVRLIPVDDDETSLVDGGSAEPQAGGFERRNVGLPAGLRAVPAYAYPESAARALGHAAAYSAWRRRQRGQVPDLGGLRTADARATIAEFLKGHPEGGWLLPGAVSDLLTCYQIPLVPGRRVTDEQEAARAAAGPGGVPVPPAPTGGVEMLIGVVQEPVFGPLVVFGPGGVAADVLSNHAARLTPLADTDADELLHSVHAAPLLFGHGGTPAVDVAALTDVLLRVSRLADDLHEVAELDLNPVIATQGGAHAVDARIRVLPAQPRDPFLRRLR
jgi:acyl-CoA synthetase (NDP forming)/GNAT superfamily N-acetyltransferase